MVRPCVQIRETGDTREIKKENNKASKRNRKRRKKTKHTRELFLLVVVSLPFFLLCGCSCSCWAAAPKKAALEGGLRPPAFLFSFLSSVHSQSSWSQLQLLLACFFFSFFSLPSASRPRFYFPPSSSSLLVMVAAVCPTPLCITIQNTYLKHPPLSPREVGDCPGIGSMPGQTPTSGP